MQRVGIGTLLVLALASVTTPANAGDYSGDTLVRVEGTVVAPDSSADVAGIPGADAHVSTAWIPSLTLTHFFTKNVAAELFCCFARLDAKGEGDLKNTDLGGFWAFPPIVTLQYHFDPIGGFKPYVGAGVQYIHYFDGGRSDLSGAKIKLDDSWGFALQGGVDFEIGRGWYLNADIKKVWEDTDAHWDSLAKANVTVDPLIVSVGVGYRFNLADLLGGAAAAPVPLK